MAECPGRPPHSVVYLVKAMYRHGQRKGLGISEVTSTFPEWELGSQLSLQRALPASPLHIMQMTIQTSQVAQIVQSLECAGWNSDSTYLHLHTIHTWGSAFLLQY